MVTTVISRIKNTNTIPKPKRVKTPLWPSISIIVIPHPFLKSGKTVNTNNIFQPHSPIISEVNKI
jgi:hypothetical protein